MAFCSKCGGEVGDGVAFCPKCGQAQTGGQVAQATQPTQSAQPGMAENVAGLLCYALGWITGIIFFLIDKRPFVRFHAAQSIVVFGGLHMIEHRGWDHLWRRIHDDGRIRGLSGWGPRCTA